MQASDLAKTDIGTVTEIHLAQVMAELRVLMEKLYRRNPSEWRRHGKPSAEFVVERVFRGPRVPDFVELAGARSTDSIRLAFRADYGGDRVLAFVAGLTDMIHTAYGNRTEFYVLTGVEPQKLYNSARNVEVAAWLLASEHRPDGAPWLLSNSLSGEVRNLSFERQFGKIIAVQDTMARIAATKHKRRIRFIVHRAASAVFLPL